MSTTTGSESAQPSDFKGKGKAADPPQDMSMEDDDESSSDEEEGVEEVSVAILRSCLVLPVSNKA